MCGETPQIVRAKGEPKTFDFGKAIDELKGGNHVARKGWNGKGIFLQLRKPGCFSENSLPYIQINTEELETDNPAAVKGTVPWLASQTDMLAEDWFVVD